MHTHGHRSWVCYLSEAEDVMDGVAQKQKPTASLPASLLVVLLPFHVVGFGAGYFFDRIYPLQAGQAVLLTLLAAAMTILVFLSRPTASQTWDSSKGLSVIILWALMSWAVFSQLGSSFSGGYARLGDYASALAIVLIIIWVRPDSHSWLRLLSTAVALTSVVSVSITLVHGRLHTGENQLFGLGAHPVLGCLATPVLSAWVIHLWLRRQNPEPPRAVEWWCCTMGWLALLTYMVLAERRGPVLAILAIAFVLVGLRYWREFPRLTVMAAVVMASVIMAYLTYQFAYHEGTGRSERYLVYRVATEIGWSAFPWGHGPFGMLAADQSQSTNSMLWVAREKAGLHAHNELLNAWIEGGIIHVGLLITLGLLLLRQVWCCPDPYLKWPYLALITAAFVHAVTDNTYGTPLGMVWCGLVIGGILTLPSSLVQAPLPRAIRGLAIVSGTIALVLGCPTVSMALLTKDTPIPDRLQTMQRCRDPLFILNELSIIVNSPQADAPMKSIAVDIAVDRAGWSLFIPRAAVAAAASNGDYPRYVEALVRIAQRNPFDLEACHAILQAVRHDQTLMLKVPQDIQQRIGVLTGLLSVEVDDNRLPTQWQAASLCLAAIWFATEHDTVNDRHRAQVIHLIQQFPQIPTICITAHRVASRSDARFTARLLTHADLVSSGVGSLPSITQALELATTPKQAAIVYPLVKNVRPRWCDRLERQETPALSASGSDDERMVFREIVRIWSLARQEGLFDRPGH